MQVLRRGRSMSQLTATVRNPGAEAGLTAIAAFGRPRRGLRLHRAGDAGRRRGPTGCAASATRSPRASTSSSTATRSRSGRRSSSAGPRSAGRRGSRSRTGPAEAAYWYRLDHPPARADGTLDVAGPDRDVRHDARARSARSSGPTGGQLVRAERRLHAPRVPARRRPAGSSPTSSARHAGDGYASVDSALWDPRPTARPSSPTPPRSCSSPSPDPNVCGRFRPHTERFRPQTSGLRRWGGSRSRRRGRRRTSC